MKKVLVELLIVTMAYGAIVAFMDMPAFARIVLVIGLPAALYLGIWLTARERVHRKEETSNGRV